MFNNCDEAGIYSGNRYEAKHNQQAVFAHAPKSTLSAGQNATEPRDVDRSILAPFERGRPDLHHRESESAVREMRLDRYTSVSSHYREFSND
jgi:hypothetical protein